MRCWIYPVIALIFNYILLNSFHWGEYGGAIAVLFTISLIAFISLILTFIHYWLNRRQKETKYFQFTGIVLVLLVSYFLFPSGDSPVSIIRKMQATAQNYSQISINDYFLENRYENYEIIVAAKKKFNPQLADTAYSVNISNRYDYFHLYKTYGINFFNGHPASTDQKQNIERDSNGIFGVREYFMDDTILFYGNNIEMHTAPLRTDSFSEFGSGYLKDTTIKDVHVERILKWQTADEEFWAYKFFYWIL